MRTDLRQEGMWRWERQPDLPTPVTDVDWPGREDFLEHLAAVEEAAHQFHFKGFSICRVCGEVNGSSSFTSGIWEWPDGFAHYIRDHGVRPTPDFEAFILSHEAMTGSPSDHMRGRP